MENEEDLGKIVFSRPKCIASCLEETCSQMPFRGLKSVRQFGNRGDMDDFREIWAGGRIAMKEWGGLLREK